MKNAEVFKAWGRILQGYYPSISIEITRECPLRCPGCYAYEPEHLGAVGPLRSVSDRKGQELVDGVIALVNRYRPLHVSIVGGEPLVRFRELDVLLPLLSRMGIAVQLVTSAVRPIPLGWSKIRGLHLAVSVDGLQPEHDERRKPATYERILRSIENHRVTIHCTITRQMLGREGYFEEFLEFWSARPEVKKVWFSFFTPQLGVDAEETLPGEDREKVLSELVDLRQRFSKLYLPDSVVAGYRNPPQSPDECIFARTTLSLTADLTNKIAPCQFGGEPDCKQCGCMASAGLKAVGDHQLLGVVPLRLLFNASDRIGKTTARLTGRANGFAG